MTDSAEHLRRVRQLFDAVIDLTPSQRRSYLERVAGEDVALQAEVAELVTRAGQTDAAFAAPLGGEQRSAHGDATDLVGQRLGPYNVVRLVGMGGMGAVYEAVRADDQYQKRVAIKIVQRGLGSELTLARFRRERQILASLEHPNIATLLDGGVTPDGQPFLVMEYIDGEAITVWCNARSLPVRARIALFRQVCAAVQYAHKNLVIHRDLKPGNILVTADGTAKLLDFGIAKLLGEENADPGMPLTRGGARAFTPEYASPEQIRGDVLTTASDLYSLGVVFFELVAGRRPHVAKSRALVDIERAVLEEPVPRPSAVVTDDAARERSERSADRLRRHLAGELDNIALMALRLEPSRRYPSIEAFGDDIRRYLADLPVLAQRDWAGYRIRKFVQRNVAAVVASALVLLAVVGGAIATTVQAHRARSEQAKEAEVNGFLRTLLSSVEPEYGRRDVQVSEVLDSAAQRLDRDRDLAGQPEVRAELESTIGQTYQELGRYDEAERHLKTALALDEKASGPHGMPVAIDLSHLGQLYNAKGALDSADATFERAITLWQAQSHKPDSLYASLLSNLASLAHNRGHLADAERLHRQAHDIYRTVLGERSDVAALSLTNVSIAVGEQGRLAEAESLNRAAIGIYRSNHPEPNGRLSAALDALASVLDMEGKVPQADSAYRATLALRKELLGPEHPDYALTLFNYASFIFDQKRYAEAAEYARQILALRGKTLPESHQATAGALQLLGRSSDKLGRTADGETALLASLALRQKYLGSSSWLVASSEGVLGEHYALVKKYAQAETMELEANDFLMRTFGASNPRTQTNIKRLVALYDAWGKTAQAAEYRAKLVPPPAK